MLLYHSVGERGVSVMAFPLVSVTGFVVGTVVVIVLIAVLVLLVTKRQ